MHLFFINLEIYRHRVATSRVIAQSGTAPRLHPIHIIITPATSPSSRRKVVSVPKGQVGIKIRYSPKKTNFWGTERGIQKVPGRGKLIVLGPLRTTHLKS